MPRKKKIKYQLGDIFLIPLENGLNGVGRVLRKNKDTILIEMYHMKPIKDESEYCYEEITKNKPLIISWTYDDGVIYGMWKIIDHKPVPDKIDMPYFVYDDCGDGKWYIKKGSEESYSLIGERIEIPERERFNYEMKGIGNEISEPRTYMRRLIEAGLVVAPEESDFDKVEPKTQDNNSAGKPNVIDNPKPRDVSTGLVNKFDTEYELLADMYDDDYYPNNLVDKIKALMEKLIACLKTGEREIEKVQEKLDDMTLGINDLEEEFDENDSEIETVARDIIGMTVDYILTWFEIDIDVETAIGKRDW